MKCWGYNSFGQLGDGSTTNSLTPANVKSTDGSGFLSNVEAIAAGNVHTCAKVAGGMKCWGYNSNGQLGDGTSGTDRLTPVDVSGLSSGVQSITAGSIHTCAKIAGGGMKCWGYNSFGQLGDGTSGTDRLTPVYVLGIDGIGYLENVLSIWKKSLGSHSCAIIPD
jgi:alpha-tubulin suppressor-like RCC1 family protein